MKKFWMIAASVLLLAACEKEAPVQQETPNNENPATDLVTYTFKASINATKAYIDDDGLASGETAPLKWSDGDKIALYNSTTEEYVEFSTTLDADATSATFTAEAPSGAVFTKAYYPADYKGEGLVTYYNAKFKSDNNPLMSLSGARKCVVMEVAEIAANATSINFSQKGSMVKFTVSNVPDFAGKATLTFGDLSETVAIASTDISDGTSVFYFPVAPDHEKSMSFSLADTASKKGYNEFYRKARESATLGCEHNGTDWVNNPSLHRFTAKVGRVIMIDDKNKLKNSSFDELAVWKVSDNTKNYRFKMSNSYPSKLNLLCDSVYYAVLNTFESGLDWAVEGVNLCVSFEDYQNGPSRLTDGVYLNRNFKFVPGDSEGLKTDYKVFPKKKSTSSATPVTIKSIPAIFVATNGYENAKIHIWGTNAGGYSTDGKWPGTQLTWWRDESGNKYWYLNMEDNTPTGDFSFLINNGSDDKKTGDLTAEFSKYSTISCDFGTVGKEFNYTESKSISLATDISLANSYNLPSAVAGKNLLLKVGSAYHPIVVNQDFVYEIE